MAVLNMYHLPNKVVPANAVYVGRPSEWGNPFDLQSYNGDRDRVLHLYRKWALAKLRTRADWLEPLRGKDLVCWCAPKACHADVLEELLLGKD